MKHFLYGSLLAGSLLLGSCASIVSHSRWPVAISSIPVGTTVTVTDRQGNQVYSGATPAALELKSGSGFFRRAIYTLSFAMPGYGTKTMTLEADVNGWYFGNLVFGGVIGFLIVDPATGAMYRFSQRQVQMTLSPTTGYFYQPGEQSNLRIMALSDVPEHLRASLVRVQ